MKSHRRPRMLAIALFGLMCLPVMANPVRDPLDVMSHGFSEVAAALALSVEVAITSALLIKIYEIHQRAVLVLLLIALNAVTFGVFILWMHQHVRSVLLLETLIWLTEAFAIHRIVRQLSLKRITFPAALAVSLLGNLASYLFGMVV